MVVLKTFGSPSFPAFGTTSLAHIQAAKWVLCYPTADAADAEDGTGFGWWSFSISCVSGVWRGDAVANSAHRRAPLWIISIGR